MGFAASAWFHEYVAWSLSKAGHLRIIIISDLRWPQCVYPSTGSLSSGAQLKKEDSLIWILIMKMVTIITSMMKMVMISIISMINRQRLRILLEGSFLLLFNLEMLFLGAHIFLPLIINKPWQSKNVYDIIRDSDTLARCTPPGLAARRGIHRFYPHHCRHQQNLKKKFSNQNYLLPKSVNKNDWMPTIKECNMGRGWRAWAASEASSEAGGS